MDVDIRSNAYNCSGEDEMRILTNMKDREKAYSKADKLLCEAFQAQEYEKAIRIYKTVMQWYA